MNYAVFSDSHDNVENSKKALDAIVSEGITEGLYLGDFSSSNLIETVLKHAPSVSWKAVFGNTDNDWEKVLEQYKGSTQFDIQEDRSRSISLPEGEILITHFPDIALPAAETGRYRAVFYGHTHVIHDEILENETLLVNPGEIIGNRTGRPSFCLWNPVLNRVTHKYIT
jgi:uncharacterized protein